MHKRVLDHFSDPEYKIPKWEPKTEKSAIAGLTLIEQEKFWLSYECISRYLRATKWKSAEAAIHRLEATLVWRREYGLYDLITPEYVEPEATTGKEILFGYDTQGRPGFYMIPSRQNTSESPRQLHYMVWMLERAIDCMEQGVESLPLLMNLGDRGKAPSFQNCRQMLHILQEHYPERLGRALVINVPFLLHAFIKLMMPFVDPITREKIRFNPDVIKEGIFAKNELMSGAWGGACDFEYVHEEYWPALVRLCEERSSSWRARWKALGGTVGIREYDYKTDDDRAPSLDEKMANAVTHIVDAELLVQATP
ncbi:CRAL/TRIO domain-containing protein [Fistulina hepatica ATCC 64428]|uniref:CRAL/TRIO domain-containing protein n=1 Tax=Fistulina hepatica ATCC 64428 TaxID=1128425 RepID=A0A0D6ZYJ5_9AGAR|nr:CRAL/TRIO domain-containing protein [Fistulina hepatica ATCC 64428]